MSQKKKRMPENLYPYYSDSKHQQTVAGMLTVLGAGIFKRSKFILEIDELQKIQDRLDNGKSTPSTFGIEEFAFEYLVDCIRILIFFENYMKAELIMNDFCVHNIDTAIPVFKSLGDRQKDKPVKLLEMQNIEPFQVDKKNKTIFHRAIKFTTLQFSIITKREYTKYYKFDESILNIIIELAEYRNRLHFNHDLTFFLSQKLIDDFKALNTFVDDLFANHLKSLDTTN